MGSRRLEEGAVHSHPHPPDAGEPPLHQIFKDTISEILTLESVRPPHLRNMYAFFCNFSLRAWADSYQLDIHKLCSIMFRNLEDGLKQYFCSVKKISSHSSSRKKNALPLDFWDQIEGLALSLRCCMLILTWMVFDQDIILKKVKFLLTVLKRLISFNVGRRNGKQIIIFKKFQKKQTYDEDGYVTSVMQDFVASLCFLEPRDPCCSSLCALLEVYADELLAAESLRKCFACVESSLYQKPFFKTSICSSEIELVLEVICAHLILHVSDEQVVENALDRLIGHHIKGSRFPELGMSTALSLLLNPILLSAPQLFQAHVILLVSEAINTGMAWGNMGMHIREVDYYLVAFEKSLYMYKRHISSYWDNKPMDPRDASLYSCSRDRSIPSFRSCIMEKTGQKLDFLDAKVQSLWDQHMQQNKTPESKSGLLSASITYIKENADFLEETHADEIISVLVSLTLRSFNDASSDSIICLKPGGNPKVIYVLSSILRLMARSLSSIMWCLNHSGSTGRLNRLKNSSPCRVYELLLHAMCCFQQFDVHLPVQTSFCKMLKAHPVSRHEQSNWMLMHFYDLLSLSFASGFDFLVKSCLSVMIQLLNLFVFEEGSIAALKSIFSPEDQSSAFGQYPRDEEAAEQGSSEKRKKSSQIASTFLKIHRQCPRIQGELGDHVEPFSLDNAREETCSGEVFFNCLMEGSREDFSDLVDFVELKENKDYSLWLKNRQKYHKWRLEKTAVLRWKRKKMMPRWKRE